MSIIIKTTNLTKIYGTQKSVDNLQMNVNKGEIYGFLGRNGAGKTTTIRMLLGLIKPTQGEIKIFGENLSKILIFPLNLVNFFLKLICILFC